MIWLAPYCFSTCLRIRILLRFFSIKVICTFIFASDWEIQIYKAVEMQCVYILLYFIVWVLHSPLFYFLPSILPLLVDILFCFSAHNPSPHTLRRYSWVFFSLVRDSELSRTVYPRTWSQPVTQVGVWLFISHLLIAAHTHSFLCIS